MKKVFSLAKSALVFAAVLASSTLFAQNVDVEATGGTNASYGTLKEAVDAVNAGTHTGVVKVLFVNNTTETAKSVVNPSGSGAASYTNLTIGVGSSVSSLITVTGNVASDRLIDVSGSNVVIDGRPGQTGSTSQLLLNLTVTSSSGVRFISTAGFEMGGSGIRYTQITGTGLTSTGSGIFLGTLAQASKDSNLVAEFNTVRALSSGIIVGSNTRPNITKNVTISNNTIVNVTTTSINGNFNSTAEGFATISGNSISHSSYNSTTTSAVMGIEITGTGNQFSTGNPYTLTITNNSIFNLATNPATGNPALRGISITCTGIAGGMTDGAGKFFVANNNIQLSPTTTTRGLVVIGLAFFGASTSSNADDIRGTFEFYHNTISLGGNNATGGVVSNTSQTRGIVLSSNSQNTTVRSMNNIIVVSRTGTGNTRHIWGQFPITSLDPFNNYNAPPTGFSFLSNFNIYFKNSTASGFIVSGPYNGGFIFPAGSVVSTLGGELTEMYGGNQETNSSEAQITFPSAGSPTFTSTFDKDTRLIGTAIAGITTDFSGATRGTPPYIGAHEGSAFPNDLTVVQVYSLGKIPYPYAFPHVVQANVKNVGVFDATNVTVTLNITGANTVTRTAVIPSLLAGASTMVSFPAIDASDITTTTGSQTLTVSLPADDVTSNDSRSMNQDLSVVTYSLGYRVPPATNPVSAGGVGYNGATGDFVAKFLCSSPSEINQARVYFSSTGGIAYNIVIYADDNATDPGSPGTLLYTSPSYTSVTSATGFDTKDISPAISVNGNFFIGVRQPGTTNVSFSYQSEAPPRSNAFYSRSPFTSTGAWTDFGVSNSPFRFLIEPRLRASDDLVATMVTSPEAAGCFTAATPFTVRVTNAGNNVADFSLDPMTINGVVTTSGGAYNYSLVVSTGTLARDAFQDFQIGVVTPAQLFSNGNYTASASVTWATDLVTDNNSTPARPFVVSRLSTYPINIGFTPTGTVNSNHVLDRFPLSGGLNWNFSNQQGSPNLVPLTGAGVLTTAIFNNSSEGSTARVQLPCLTSPNAAFPVLQFYMSQDDNVEPDSLRIMFSTDGGLSYNFHSNYARTNTGTGWRVVKVNLPSAAAAPNLRIALDAKKGSIFTGRDISVHDIQIYDCGTGGLWLGSTNDWFDGNNWCSGSVPTAATTVNIEAYAGVSNPVVSGALASCKSLRVWVGKSLTLGSAAGTGLVVNGNVELESASQFIDNGAPLGTTIDGGAGSTINTRSGNSKRFNKLAISGTVATTANTKLEIAEELKLNSEAVFTNNGSVTLLSTSTMTANLATVDGLSAYIGNITVDRFVSPSSALTSGAYHQVASPIQNQTMNSMFSQYASNGRLWLRYDSVLWTNGLWYYANVWKYNPISTSMASNGWETLGGGNYAMTAGKSTRMWFLNQFHIPGLADKTSTYTVTGLPNIGSFSAFLDFCATGCAYSGTDPNGFNLIGNPYPSAIDWTSVSGSSTNVDDAIWTWNAASGNYGSFVGGVGANGQTAVIPSSAGFFVRANAPGAAVNFQEAHKSTNATTSFLRSGAVSLFRINLSGAGVTATDEAVVAFRPTATRGYDRQFDAAKMAGSILSLATVPVVGSSMSINSMPEMTATTEDLVLSVYARTSGTYNLTFGGFQGIDPSAQIYLKDNLTNTLTPVTQGTNYSFAISTSNPASSATGRFVLTYGLGTPTSIANGINTKAAMVVYPNPSSAGDELSVSVANLGSQTVKVSVLDVLGRVAYTSSFAVNGTETQVANIKAALTSGVYTVALEGQFGRMTQKITVK
jgi:hypothetical protein